MKKNLKKLANLFTLLVLIFLYSCSSERIEESKANSGIILKNISLDELSLSLDNKKILESVKAVSELKNNASRGGDYNSEFDFFIVQDRGKYIESGNSKSYTFPIFRLGATDNDIENIIFTLRQDGGFDVVTAKYDLSKEELEAPTFSGQIAPTDFHVIAGRVTTPKECSILMCNNDGCGGSGASHIAGDNCYNPAFLFYIIIYYGGSSNTTTTTTTTPPGPIDTSTTSSGSNTNGTPNNGGVTTAPVGGLTATQLNFLHCFEPEDVNSIGLNNSIILNYINTCTVSQSNAAVWFFRNCNLEFYNTSSQQTLNSIFSYLTLNNFSEQSSIFVNHCINQMIINNLTIDIFASAKSPYLIDKTAITNAFPGGEKFNAIYNKLTQVPEFKSLFVDMFSDSQTKFNVKFQITDIPYDNGEFVNADTEETTQGNFVIRINSQMMTPQGTHPATKIEIAKTILHESIHAYLMVKALHPTVGVPIPNAGNMNVEQLLNAVYPVGTAQHNFMIQHMLPTMETILNALLNQLTSAPKRAECVQFGEPQPWVWSNYIHYLSLQGLEETNDFINQFGITYNNLGEIQGNNEYGILSNYISSGHLFLDFINP